VIPSATRCPDKINLRVVDSVTRAGRLGTARAELAAQAEFDHVIVNREIGQATDELVALLGL